MLIQKIAADAFKRKISDPKEVSFIYSKNEKSKKISDWEENITFREDGDEILLF